MRLLKLFYKLVLCLFILSIAGLLLIIFGGSVVYSVIGETKYFITFISFFLSAFFFSVILTLLDEGRLEIEFITIDITDFIKKVFPEWRTNLLSRQEQLELY